MEIKIEKKPQSLAELCLTVAPHEYDKFLKKAAEKISYEVKIGGFRPGKAPYNIIKARVGEGEIMREALADIVTNTFVDAITEVKLTTIGKPEINIKKMTPGENLEFTALVTLLPTVDLPELKSIKIDRQKAKVDDNAICHTVEHLARSRAKEIAKNEPAADKDLVKLDYNIQIAGVVQEGGQQKDFDVYLGEKHMVPGFEENIIGLKVGDEKKFTITFPKNYFQKNFAGKECEFTVKIKGVFRLDLPAINDEFAKSLGKFKNLAELKKQIYDNLYAEEKTKLARIAENEMFDKLIKKTIFGEIPQKLVDSEIDAMLNEIKSDLEMKGLQFQIWLDNMRKKEADLRKDFAPQAERRVKSALIIKVVAAKEKIEAKGNDIKEEIKKLENMHRDNMEILNSLKSPEYYDYLANSLTSQKVVDWLRHKIIR